MDGAEGYGFNALDWLGLRTSGQRRFPSVVSTGWTEWTLGLPWVNGWWHNWVTRPIRDGAIETSNHVAQVINFLGSLGRFAMARLKQ